MHQLSYRTIIVAALLRLASPIEAQRLMYSATNFSADLAGEPDSRPNTWGTAEAVKWEIRFNPPPNCRVEIRSVSGDLVAWPLGKVEKGKFAGVLFGLQTTGPEGSVRGDWLADNCFLFICDGVGAGPRRAPFSERVTALLEPDHILVVKVAVWLNDTGRKIHIEPTMTLGYQFVDRQGRTCPNESWRPRFSQGPAITERVTRKK